MEINHKETLRKNTAVAPGLTIVYWGREDAALLDAFEREKERLNQQWRPHIWWYAADHIHVTLSALTRTKYDQFTALRRGQLPEGLSNLVQALSGLHAFEVVFSALAIRQDGQIQFNGRLNDPAGWENIRIIREVYQSLDPELTRLDRPKSDQESLHVNIGYFQKAVPGLAAAVWEMEPVAVRIETLSIVHYLRRTLEPRYILGQLHLPFGNGRTMPVNPDYFYDILSIKP